MHDLLFNIGVVMIGGGTLIFIGALAFFTLNDIPDMDEQDERDRYWYGEDEHDGEDS